MRMGCGGALALVASLLLSNPAWAAEDGMDAKDLIEGLAKTGLSETSRAAKEKKLLALGKEAIPPLLERLDDGRIVRTRKRVANENLLTNAPAHIPAPKAEIRDETVTLGAECRRLLLRLISPAGDQSLKQSRRKPISAGPDQGPLRVEDWKAWWAVQNTKTLEQMREEAKSVIDRYREQGGVEQALTVSVTGTARDAKGGAVVHSVSAGPVYIAGLESWDAKHSGLEVTAIGVPVERKLIGDPVTAKDGARSAGAHGLQLVLEKATWRPAAVGENCLARWTLSKAGSVLEEQRRLGPPLNDFPESFAAAAIDATAFHALEATRAYQLDGRPLLWLTPDRRAVVVDERAFSALEAADPTRLNAGESKTVGRLTPAARAKLDRRALAEFLLKSGAIRTFWHMESDVCLEREQKTAKLYQAVFSGTHTYYTNAKHEGSFAFTLTVDADGLIVVASTK